MSVEFSKSHESSNMFSDNTAQQLEDLQNTIEPRWTEQLSKKQISWIDWREKKWWSCDSKEEYLFKKQVYEKAKNLQSRQHEVNKEIYIKRRDYTAIHWKIVPVPSEWYVIKNNDFDRIRGNLAFTIDGRNILNMDLGNYFVKIPIWDLTVNDNIIEEYCKQYSTTDINFINNVSLHMLEQGIDIIHFEIPPKPQFYANTKADLSRIISNDKSSRYQIEYIDSDEKKAVEEISQNEYHAYLKYKSWMLPGATKETWGNWPKPGTPAKYQNLSRPYFRDHILNQDPGYMIN